MKSFDRRALSPDNMINLEESFANMSVGDQIKFQSAHRTHYDKDLQQYMDFQEKLMNKFSSAKNSDLHVIKRSKQNRRTKSYAASPFHNYSEIPANNPDSLSIAEMQSAPMFNPHTT